MTSPIPKLTASRQVKYPYYGHIPALVGARFVFIEEALWLAGKDYARTQRYKSKPNWDLDVLHGVTRLALKNAVVVRTATDRSVVLTATASYLRSVQRQHGHLIRISMSAIRSTETIVERRNGENDQAPHHSEFFADFG